MAFAREMLMNSLTVQLMSGGVVRRLITCGVVEELDGTVCWVGLGSGLFQRFGQCSILWRISQVV